MAKKKPKTPDNVIAQNRRARHEYHIEETYEAGLSLLGWEVKSLRAGRVTLSEAYIFIRDGEGWLDSANITPLISASTHVTTNGLRLRKLLMHRRELNSLIGQVERKGYTLIPLSLYWARGRVKLSLGLAKGKQAHDKRATIKERDWQREKARIMKHR
ncbi:MAG: SsrA-binding protein SmpB [Gammaproteobacteria bacterium]|nr:SsrA-binding protein SmpB [Gammaproteobacteria bacterium]